jgi:restriction system protein
MRCKLGKVETLLFLSIVAFGVWVYILHQRNKKDYQQHLLKLGKLFSIRDDLHKTLLAGLYQRFKKEDGKTEDTPLDFEHFVAKVIQQYQGGKVEVTPGSGDGGIDLIHYREDGLYFGQVKCYNPNNNMVNYEPIAILHSQMVKQQAKGGFLVTTSNYNNNAVLYAEGLNIQLINGDQLLDMWIHAMEETKQTYLPVKVST